jgi:hypothetical protein
MLRRTVAASEEGSGMAEVEDAGGGRGSSVDSDGRDGCGAAKKGAIIQ